MEGDNLNAKLKYALLYVNIDSLFQCQNPFSDNDIVVLNGTDEDIEKLREQMSVRVANRKIKKSKSVKEEKVEIKCEPAVTSDSKEPQPGSSQVKNEDDKTQLKKELTDTIPLSLPKFNPNKQARGHFGSFKRAHPNTLQQDPSYKKTKKDYSIANDPQSSEVYKSLFTSHKSEEEQKRAHWVTYNPFYN